jgi:maltose-binding protein MalE
MPSIRKHSRLLLVGAACLALGAGASAIASAGATTTSSSHPAAKKHSAAKRTAHLRGLRRYALRAVQGSVVVRDKTGFGTVTFDRGKVDSVNGRQLTITDGTAKANYKTTTVTVPADAVVRDDRQKASLSDLKAGQRVLVLVAPKRTLVVARTPHGG